MKLVFALPALPITTGVYIMSNGRKAHISYIKENGQAVGAFEHKPRANGAVRGTYWVWEYDGRAKFVEPSEFDLVKKLV